MPLLALASISKRFGAHQALDAVSRGYVSAKDMVNRVEPLANLLAVMQHLMSHNGHLKTAIIP